MKSSNTFWIWVVSALGIGSVLIATSLLGTQEFHPLVISLTGNLGSFIVATVLVSVVFTHFVNRDLMREVVGKTRVVDLVVRVGLVGLWSTFHDRVDWQQFISSTKSLDVFVAYAHSWRQANMDYLRSMLEHKDSAIRVILPDFRSGELVEELARRFDKQPDEMERKIRAAAESFLRLNEEDSCRGTVKIVFVSVTPQISFYIADSSAVLATFTYRPNHSVMTLQVTRGGELYRYVVEEREALLGLQTTEAGSLDELATLTE